MTFTLFGYSGPFEIIHGHRISYKGCAMALPKSPVEDPWFWASHEYKY